MAKKYAQNAHFNKDEDSKTIAYWFEENDYSEVKLLKSLSVHLKLQ